MAVKISGTTVIDNSRNLTNIVSYDANAGTLASIDGGISQNAESLGTISSGTTTLTPSGGNIQSLTNGGAFTLAAPTASGDYTMILQITNNASAGAITFSGFTEVSGASLTTTDGHDFMVYVAKVNGFTHAHVVALQ